MPETDPLPDSLDGLARTCEACGRQEDERWQIVDGKCQQCRYGRRLS